MFKKSNPFFQDKIKLFQNSSFPAVIMKWNRINVNIRNSDSCNVFKKVVLKFIVPEPDQVFNVDSSEGLKFLARIRLGLSILTDHKFRHIWGQKTETSSYFLLHCSNNHCARQNLFEKVNEIDSTILKPNEQVITNCLLFGNKKMTAAQNKPILTSTIGFVQDTQRFETSIFN